MRKGLYWTDRCSLFENIATDVWNRIIYAHDVKMDLPEIGITADIIVDILHYAKSHPRAFDVYAMPGYKEKWYGSDMDVFVEVAPNQFKWFALQAKVLKVNNTYDTFRDSSDTEMQWDKLAHLESTTGCKAYYLLYNGKNKFSYSGIDSCGREFSQDQFGCSLVEPTEVANLAKEKNEKGFISPKFTDFHPSLAQPWRILTCCKNKNTVEQLYKREQILKLNPKLKKISKLELIDNKKQNEFGELTVLLNDKLDVNIDGIIESRKQVNWNPPFQILIPLENNIE